MKKNIQKVALRNQAIFIADMSDKLSFSELNETTSVLIVNARKLGYSFSEDLVRALNAATATKKLEVLEALKEITGVNKNWTPLVRGWDTSTGESLMDHVITFFGNLFGSTNGTRLACGHLIPVNTFPLERYNGCPYCGTPFQSGEIQNFGQGSKLKVLDLWTEKEVEKYLADLLVSKTALDATQLESLNILLQHYSIPQDINISMKETLMAVVDALVEKGEDAEASTLFKTPTDIMRYLWYKHTGFHQIIKPKTIIARKASNAGHIRKPLAKSQQAATKAKQGLKLKYNRTECRRVATWLNDLDIAAGSACEIMHPHRNMWTRFIRALRLTEYAKKKGFENLALLLDTFHNENYEVYQGRLNYFRLKVDADNTFRLLKQRPGLFARSLFSNMLWFGADETLLHFMEIADKIPARLVLTLNMYSRYYFNRNGSRTVSPLGGTKKKIPANQLLELYTDEQLKEMQHQIEELCIYVMQERFMKIKNDNSSIYIAPQLFNMPLSIGDRSETVQDLPSALMGTKFPLEGDKVRLFMQWGTGLKAQHLDMDLSCKVAYADRIDYCSYSQLNIVGCKHSGDIINIPNKIGTAEYIEIDVSELARYDAKYVTFTCNAYSNGSISPNLVIGWMDSKNPMKVSEKTGVAYDPSCVQHQVRVTQGLSKGLVFGVLDIKQREIVWLEMPFSGQIVQGLDLATVEALLSKLNSKLTIGYLLELKAQVQALNFTDHPEVADEVYDMKWAMNTAGVTQLLVD